MTSISPPRKIPPRLLCALPLAAYAAGCGVTDVPFGAQPSGPRPVIPEGNGSPSPLGGGACEFGGFEWRSKSFALYPDGQDCSGQQWVRYDAGLGLWVGLTACSGDEARVYLSDTPKGPFLAAADTAGHGQDHCELVDAAFTLTDEDDITSGGCTNCSAGVDLSLGGSPVYARAGFGEPFTRVEAAPEGSHRASRLRCGVELGCSAPRSSSSPELSPSLTTAAAVTLPPGCEALAAESTFCLGLQDGVLTAIGLDSGALCAGPAAQVDTFSVASLGWVGEYAYACNFPDNQLYRISVRDGSVEVAELPCDAATSHAGGILVMNGLGAPAGGGLWHFDSFEAIQRGEPQQSYDLTPFATRFATNGDRIYAAWHSTPFIETAPIEPGGALSPVNLQGFDDWIWAMDVLDDGRLLLNSGYFSNVDGLLVFDAATGESRGVLPVGRGGSPARLQGLDCVSRKPVVSPTPVRTRSAP